ncbi:flagellar biosynthesis regulator FlbT [Ameyamaea chiangmaiensis NBRC 103196]|uniref:Flagellar biosynthesis repressor FlbT n=1 Tax=Ameyamaea chiangmaiensis TaxID=442969 RepID=A0A850P536_9PROT|nr:flagellar biosynthesis repressor FlbT [Ameyamaea chiangmaiensis]MBS4075959.1 flagellar biosynthesis repressor FlbT [Ameyamaea chiangmaiensis]NVN39755.1 flagellar biosynthesis repressor FlbT [Ameyamaea chiangmaiensis]GBQ61614.1 flagellar biosynthesis regulator FlbT [Ameyamaea chiangmaiensis NBRC 103196]
MAGLGIRLDAGDKLIVNGAAIHFVTAAQIRLANRARFLFGRQIMAPDEVTTPARRLYYALQTAYVGTERERAMALEEATFYAATFSAETTSDTARTMIASAMDAARHGDGYRALTFARRIVRHEDAVFAHAASE